ncbi:MAG: HlyD family efflux transporter periplasmic adaptor subunit [Verrucomicrobiales bacterium]|nr:HlyD family efflux transporter periplasmic adaptor subunit [Verrucomicrobiales bacterium]
MSAEARAGTAPEAAVLNTPDTSPLFQAKDEVQFHRGMAALIAESTGATAILFAARDDGPILLATRLRGSLPAGLLDDRELKSTLSAALASGNLVSHKFVQADLILWALPVKGEGNLGLALLAKPSLLDAGGEARMLAWIAVPEALFAQRKLRLERDTYRDGLDQACFFLDTLHRSGSAPSYARGMQALAEDLRQFVGADRVAIGLGTPMRCKAAALVPASKFDQNSEALVKTSQLMREAIAVGCSIGWPVEAVPVRPGANLAGDQGALLETMKARAVTCHLLRDLEGKGIGAWVCWWESVPTPEKWDLAEVLSPHLAATARLIRLARPAGIAGLLQSAGSKTKRSRYLVFASLAIVFAGAMFLKMPYKLRVSCWIDPAVKRQVAAPFDGILSRALVEPGSTVTKDQVLAELDGKEIEWKLADVRSRLNALTKRRDQALAAENMPDSQIAALEIATLEVERDLLHYQRDHLTVRSPIDGLVLTGDLDESEGVPVQRGQRLFDIAPIRSFSVRLAVPAGEARHVAPGMEVRIRLEAETDFRKVATLETIEPISSIHESKNVFLGTTTLRETEEALRPGMRGKARIVAGSKRLGWILFHRPLDWLRLRLPW